MKQPTFQQWLLIGIFVLGLMAMESIAMHQVYATRVQGTADFFARWYGAKELVLHGRNPYDREIDLEAQMIMFGRHTAPEEDQVNFAYPLYTIFLFWPLTLVSYAWAQAIWMVVLQFALMGGTILLSNLLRWRPPLWLFLVTIFWSVFFYPGARTIFLGQFSGLIFFFLTLSMWGLLYNKHALAGAVLPLTTVKPQVVFLIIPFMLLYALRQKYWRFIIAFGVSTAVLLLASIAWVPQWPLQFFNNLSAYSAYVGFGSPLENMTAQFIPALDWLLNPLITLILGLGLLGWWWHILKDKPELFLWGATLTLLVGNLIAFRSATTNHVTLYLAICLSFKRLALLGTKGNWTILLLQIGSTIALWVIFLTTIDTARGANFEAIFMHGLLPTALIIYYLLDWQKLKAALPPLMNLNSQS